MAIYEGFDCVGVAARIAQGSATDKRQWGDTPAGHGLVWRVCLHRSICGPRWEDPVEAFLLLSHALDVSLHGSVSCEDHEACTVHRDEDL